MRSLLVLSCALAASQSVDAQSGWSTPTLVNELNTTAADTAPHISFDGLTMHFASFISGNWEIWSATRPARGLPFGTPVIETALNAPETDSGPFLSADGLEIYFETLRPGGQGGFDLMRATRPTPVSPWNSPTFVTELNSSGSEASPTMTADGLTIYFLSTSFGAPFAPNNSVVMATRPNRQSPFGTPTVVAELAASQGARDSHRDVCISPDGLRILLTRYLATTGRLEVLEARRTNRNSPFGPEQILTEFSTVGTLSGVFSASLSSDGNELFLAAGFAAAAGSQEILVSRFDGLTSNGIATATTAMDLNYRDSSSPNLPRALVLSGGNTGFPLGMRTVPVDADAIFFATFGTDIPSLTLGFLGNLNGSGESTAQLRNPLPILIGTQLYVCAFTLSVVEPNGVKTISNPLRVELQ